MNPKREKDHNASGITISSGTVTSAFSSLHESLQQVLAQRLDWSELRVVQEQTYGAVSTGNDTLVIAPTAGGKSEAALIPVMDDILKNGRSGVTCLYLSPLKALINDQDERFSAFCIPTSLSVLKWHGDVSKGDRSWKEEPPHFLMITPESLEVLLDDKILSADLRQVRYIIIDELHAFVETERGVHLKVLLSRMDRLTKRNVQRIGLSATAGNPREILAWLSDGRQGEKLVFVPAAPKEKHFRFIVEPEENRRIDLLVRVVAHRKALVFVNSRSMAEHLMQALKGRVHNLHVHHSSLSAEMRGLAEDAILSPDGACIICTSTLELGIDIGSLDVVVQVGLPDSVSSFLQRMGRSGRRGQAAFVVWVLQNSCELLCSCAIIECAFDRQVEELHSPERPYNVVLQQILLSLHHNRRVGRRRIASELHSYPVFSTISLENLDEIFRHLIAEGYITTDGGMLMPGIEAERVFGRSNWKDLYSVISGRGEYRAVTPDGEIVGKLDARFVNNRSEGDISLGGHTWSVVKCDETHNLVVIVPSRAGVSQTFWTGSSAESGLSSLICERIGQIRARGSSVLPLGEPEKGLLQEALGKIPGGAGDRGLYVQERNSPGRRAVVVYSLHGNRFNRVLALILKEVLGRKVHIRATDFLLYITGAGKPGVRDRVVSALEAVRGLSLEEAGVMLPVPPRDGWKFAGLLPDNLFSASAIMDYYHVAEFLNKFSLMEIIALPHAGTESFSESE